MAIRTKEVTTTEDTFICDFCGFETGDYSHLLRCALCSKNYCYTHGVRISHLFEVSYSRVCPDCFPLIEAINEEMIALRKSFDNKVQSLRSAFESMEKKVGA